VTVLRSAELARSDCRERKAALVILPRGALRNVGSEVFAF
jgi:hypothetical protein